MTRFLPHPWLSLFLVVVWLLLVNTVSVGNILLGAVLGLLIPVATAAYWPDRPQGFRPGKMVSYIFLVIVDIFVANFVVAWKVLFSRNADLQPAWVSIPLDLHTPEAISILAGTITLTPGTVTADVSNAGHALLVHCLDAPDPQEVQDEIKTRYERRLKEIFE